MSDVREGEFDPQGLPTVGDGRDAMVEPLIVIALAGLARAGKDTAAKFLIAEHSFVRVSLADPIRSMFANVGGPAWDAHKELADAEKSLRWAMQTIGDECRNEAGCPNVWIDVASVALRYFAFHHPSLYRRFVITDCRRPDEAATIGSRVERWGGRFEVWKVIRPDGPTIKESGHSSEKMVGGIVPDRELWNVGTKGHVGSKVNKFMQDLETGIHFNRWGTKS